MDRKAEIKKDLFQILKDVYRMDRDKATEKQDEFLDKAMDYLDANISLRRKVIKDKGAEKDAT